MKNTELSRLVVLFCVAGALHSSWASELLCFMDHYLMWRALWAACHYLPYWLGHYFSLMWFIMSLILPCFFYNSRLVFRVLLFISWPIGDLLPVVALYLLLHVNFAVAQSCSEAKSKRLGTVSILHCYGMMSKKGLHLSLCLLPLASLFPHNSF